LTMDICLLFIGKFTVFAPSNEALSALDDSVAREITGDDDNLLRVVRHHLVPGGRIFSSVIRDDTMVQTADEEGPALRFNVVEAGDFGKLVTAGGVEIDLDRVDLRASNGIVHFLKDVIYPLPQGTIYQVSHLRCFIG